MWIYTLSIMLDAHTYLSKAGNGPQGHLCKHADPALCTVPVVNDIDGRRFAFETAVNHLPSHNQDQRGDSRRQDARHSAKARH